MRADVGVIAPAQRADGINAKITTARDNEK